MNSAVNSSRNREISCPICAAQAHIVYQSYPGYREPSRYDIGRCFHCDTNFALSNGEDLSDLYDQIYSHEDVIPGYSRYLGYASEIVSVPDPLDFLARKEVAFWGTRAALEREPKSARVLDIGSGLGYLTYALNQAGYLATGLDISETVVRKAVERFGNFYTAADLFKYAQQNRHNYDVVALISVIAQVPNITEFLRACFLLTKPGGKIIVITPNKHYYAPHVLWALGAPPMLLYWLSASSLTALAHQNGAEVEFVDLSSFPRSGAWRLQSPPEFVTARPVLDSNGKPAIRSHSPILLRIANSIRKRLNRDDVVRFPDDGSKPSPVLCAVFTKAN